MEQNNLNIKLYYFMTFLKLAREWGLHIKEFNLFKQETKWEYNKSMNGLESLIEIIDKKLPVDIKEDMDEKAFIINDLFDMILKNDDVEQKENVLLLLNKIVNNEIEFQ